jgi:hypothetical protein
MNTLRNVAAVLDPSGMVTVSGRLTYPRTATGLDGFNITARASIYGGPVDVSVGDGYPRTVVVVDDAGRYGRIYGTRAGIAWLYRYLGFTDPVTYCGPCDTMADTDNGREVTI